MQAGAGVATMRDGRRLEYYVEGDPDGFPVVMHHGTPGSGAPYPQVARPSAERGLALVQYTRAGYGASTRREGRSVADVAEDVSDLLDHLGLDRFATLGWSGGGPHSLACAARLAGRCEAAATGAGVGPYLNDGTLDFLDGMGPENHVEFGAAIDGLDKLVPYLEGEAEELRTAEVDEIGDTLGGLVSPVDKAFVTGEFAEHLKVSFGKAVENGVWGWADDDLAFTRDWGFGLEAISAVPVSVWQGAEDQMVPFSHGIYLADHLAGARRHLYDHEGHLSLVGRMGDILDDLLDLAGRR